MKISKLRVNNYIGIQELELNPSKITLIKGAKGQGKTSILQSIETCLKNQGRRPKLIRDSETEAEILIETDTGLKVSRKLKSDGKSKLKVENDGVKPRAPQSFLNDLVGEFAFNPVDFISKSSTEQEQILLSIMPINITEEDMFKWFEEIPKEINLNQHGLEVLRDIEEHYYDLRKQTNRTVKELASELDIFSEQIPKGYDADMWRNKSLAEIYSKISDANFINNGIVKAKNKIESSQSKIETVQLKAQSQKSELVNNSLSTITDKKHEIARLQDKIKALEADIVKVKAETKESIAELEKRTASEIAEIKENTKAAKEWLDSNPPVEIESIEEELKHAEEMKNLVGVHDIFQSKKERYMNASAEADKYDRFVKLSRSLPSRLMSNLDIPIENLKVTKEGILVNERPLENMSDGEMLKFAINVAKSLAGDLKIILIDRFESLNKEEQQKFLAEVKDDEFQYIITEVADGPLKINKED